MLKGKSQGSVLHPQGEVVFEDLKPVQETFWAIGSWHRYGQSKLANLLYGRELPLRYPAITSVSIHPNVVAADLVGDQNLWQRALIHASQFGKLLKPEEGALADREKIEDGSCYKPVGSLFHGRLDKMAKDDTLTKRLWEWTEQELKNY